MPTNQDTGAISSRELSFRTFGNDGTGEGRVRKARERAAERRSQVVTKRRREEKLKPDQIVTIMVETAVRLQSVAARQMRAGHLDGTRTDRILSRTVKHRSSGFIAIAPNAEDAAFLAAWLRSPGVDQFCDVLDQLDTLAGSAAPQGRPIDVPMADFLPSLVALERSGAADAVAAARHLRTAGTKACHARFHVTPEAAGPIGDALHAVGAPRPLVNSLDQIANRAEPRPF